MFQTYNHITVLQKETVQAILPSGELLQLLEKNKETFVVVDCTLGGGGHAATLVTLAREIETIRKHGMVLVGFDRDARAIEAAKARLDSLEGNRDFFRFLPIQQNFSEIRLQLQAAGISAVHGLYADFGVSSHQLDTAERGFSFLREGPLDMRMDPSRGPTARDVLNTESEAGLLRIFNEYGEEPRAKKLAQAIVTDRVSGRVPLDSTTAFAEYVARVLNYPKGRAHPATRTFQALRIAVNNELGSIEELLDATPEIASDFARVAYISFHSLEDRIVKQRFRAWESEERDPVTGGKSNVPGHKECWGKETPRGGTEPSDSECKENPRARSARLRVFQFYESERRKG